MSLLSRYRAPIALIAALLTLGTSSAAPAAPQLISPSCGDTIGPGGSWRLATELLCASDAAALTIVGPTKLDLAGATITCGTTNNDAVGIEITGAGARVANGFVAGCREGIRGDGDDHVVRSVSVSQFGYQGIVLVGNRGSLVGNRVVDAQGDAFAGYTVNGSGNALRANVFRDSRSSFTSRAFAVGGDANKIVKNVVERARHGYGFRIAGDGNIAKDNVVGASTFSGVFLTGDGNRASGNTIRRVTGDDVFEVQGTNAVVRANLIADWNTEDRLGFILTGSGHRLIDNVAVTCTAAGYLIEATDVVQRGNVTHCP